MAVIAISGDPGVGKSTLVEKLSAKYNYRTCSAGSLQRKYAESIGKDIKDAFAQTTADDNKKIDELLLAEARKGDVIIDGRYSAIICARNDVPAFRVFLYADLEERARRFKKNPKNKNYFAEPEFSPKCYLLERQLDENHKCQELYETTYTLSEHYDFHLDTTKLNAQEVFAQVIKAFEDWKASLPETTAP